MVLSLRLYERSFSKETKRWQQKIINVMKIENEIKEFTFGKNKQTRDYVKNINSYTFLAAEQGRFKLLANGKNYLYTPLPPKPSFLKASLSFLWFNLGMGETMITDPLAISIGDKIVYKGEDKELIIEVTNIY